MPPTNDIATTANEVYRDNESQGVPSTPPNEPVKAEIRGLFGLIDTKVEALESGQAGGSYVFGTWSELDALSEVGITTGARAEVYGDAGTHTDPVVGGTVANTGIYSFVVGQGWKWISMLSIIALSAEVDALDELAVKAAPGEDGPTLAANALLQGKVLYLSPDGLTVGGSISEASLNGLAANDARTVKTQMGDAAPLLVDLDDLSGYTLGLSDDGASIEQAITALPDRTPGPLGSVTLFSDQNGAAVLSVDPDDNSLMPLGGISMGRMGRILGGGNAHIQSVNHRLVFGESGRGVAGGPGFYTTAAQIGSPYPLMNIRWAGDFYAATVQELDRWTCEVLTRANGPGKTAVAVAATSLPMVAIYGQSTAGNPGGAVLLAGEAFPHHALTLGAIAASATASAPFTQERLTYLVAAKDTEASPYVATVANFALEQFDRDANRRSGGAIVWTSWEGGRDIYQFVQGTTNYTNLTNGFKAAVSAAPLWGRTAAAAGVVFVQGESGPYGQSTYQPLLNTLVTNLLADAAPRVFIVQTNVQSNPAHPEYPAATGVELAQLAVAQARHADGVTFVGPMYQFPLADGIHPTSIGRTMQSEMIAAAVDDVVRLGLDRPAFAPLTITRSSATLTLTFPAFFSGLAWDTTWVRALTDKGFVCTKASDGSALTISSVTVATPTTVQIVLSANPGEVVNVAYAMQNEAGATLGWARGWGQLICPTTRQSYAYRKGVAVPQYINHYCARFSVNSAT